MVRDRIASFLAWIGTRADRHVTDRIPTWVTPNQLTVVRGLCLIPVYLWRNDPWPAFGWMLLSSFCDIFDGRLARRRNVSSAFGELLDPAMDKIFILGTLWIAYWARIPTWIQVSVTAFEAVLIFIRPVKNYAGATSASNDFGKVKTWAQSIALMCVAFHAHAFDLAAVGVFLAGLLLAALSFLRHVQDVYRHLREKIPPSLPTGD